MAKKQPRGISRRIVWDMFKAFVLMEDVALHWTLLKKYPEHGENLNGAARGKDF